MADRVKVTRGTSVIFVTSDSVKDWENRGYVVEDTKPEPKTPARRRKSTAKEDD